MLAQSGEHGTRLSRLAVAFHLPFPSEMAPIDILVIAVDDINASKHPPEPLLSFTISGGIDDLDTQRRVTAVAISRDFCELHLCHCVEVGHREPDDNGDIGFM